MTDEGVYSVHRGIFEHPLFKNQPERFYAWNWMLAHAVWKETRVQVKGRVIPLERGQLTFSERFMAEKWKWPKSNVNRFLALLEREKMIVRKADHGQNQITLCNYNEYQLGRTSNRTESGPAADQQRTKEESLNHSSKETGKGERVRRAPSTIPDGWQPSDDDVAFALKLGFSPSKVSAMAEAFADHHRAKGSRMRDWSAAWRNWVRNEIKFNGVPNGANRPKSELIQAADDLVSTINSWGLPYEVGGGENPNPVRLLPQGRRERPGDLHGGSGGGAGGVRAGRDLPGDRSENGTTEENEIPAEPGRSLGSVRAG